MSKLGKKKIVLSSFLILIILLYSVYIFMPEKVKMVVGKTNTEFYVWEDESWVLGATEYINLFDGTTKMRASSRLIETQIGQVITIIKRTSKWKDNITTISTYSFDSTINNVELFPISHKLECFNCKGKILHFEYRDILYMGETRTAYSPESFGHNMKIEWDSNAYYSKVFQQKVASDKLIIRYRPESNYEVFNVRMFDPDSWYNTTYDRRVNVTNVPSNVNLTLLVNGSGLFYGERLYVNPIDCLGGTIKVYYNDSDKTFNEVVCNDTTNIDSDFDETGAYYPEDTSGIFEDITPTENNGTITGATFVTDGYVKGDYKWDGNDVVTISDWNDGTGDFTICVVANFTDAGVYTLFDSGSPSGRYLFRIGHSGAGNIKFTSDNGPTVKHLEYTDATTTDGDYHDHCFVRNTTSTTASKLYLDGVVKVTTGEVLTGDISVGGPGTVCMGAICGGGQDLVGHMDEIAYYSRVLSSTEVLARFNNLKPSPSNILLGAEESVPIISPIMQTSRISPTSPNELQNLLGYCNATEADGETLQYYFRWFKNETLNKTGSTSSGITQGIETNVDNISSSLTTAGDNWTIECQADDGTTNSSALNSTGTIIRTTNFTATLNSDIVELIYNPSWNLVNWSDIFDNATVNNGSYSWNLTENNILPVNGSSFTYNLTNDETSSLSFLVKVNNSDDWWSSVCGGVTVGTSATNITVVSALSSSLVNCSLNVNLSQTYSNWTLDEDNATWVFNLTWSVS